MMKNKFIKMLNVIDNGFVIGKGLITTKMKTLCEEGSQFGGIGKE